MIRQAISPPICNEQLMRRGVLTDKRIIDLFAGEKTSSRQLKQRQA
jgi:hypothetical protein